MTTGCVYEMFSPNCKKTYIGSTINPPRVRLCAHKYKNHPIFQYGDVDVRVLEVDIPRSELRRREGYYIRQKMGNLFNSRVAGRSQKEKYWEDPEASRAYHRALYTPKKAGGDGQYRQLNRYNKNSYNILRQMCLKYARDHGTLPSRRSMEKYNFTEVELRTLR